MFVRIFGWSARVRQSFGVGALLLAVAGGALAIWAALGSNASTVLRFLHGITGLGAVIAGRRIYRSSLGILFPRARMNLASIVCGVVGAIMFFAGLGVPAIVVLGAGLLGFVGAHL